MIPIDNFEAQSMTGKFVPIFPGAKNIRLTFHNRKEYVEKALLFRLKELDKQVCSCSLLQLSCGSELPLLLLFPPGHWQVALVREGLAVLVPVPLLSLYSASKLERMVCGCEELDVMMLKKIAKYAYTHRPLTFSMCMVVSSLGLSESVSYG